MMAGGRQAREAARARSTTEITDILQRVAAEQAPWLLTGASPPKGAHALLAELRRVLGREARTEAEALAFSEALLDRVEVWNIAHPGDEVAPPGAVAVLNTRPPAWSADSLADLRAARPLQDGLEAAFRALAESPVQDPKGVGGLALASALFDSACLARHDLELFAAWLADPGGAIFGAPDLPPWVNLKRRAPSTRGRAKPQPLRKASGTDSQGDFALRRLVLSPRTLELVALYDGLDGAPEVLTKAAKTPDGLAQLIAYGCGAQKTPALRSLLKGAALLLQCRAGGPDLTMALLAARRLESFAATPESWTVLLQGPVSQDATEFESINTAELLTESHDPAPPSTRPVPEHPAFLQLHVALSSSQRARDDLTTPDKKLMQGDLIGRLEALPWDSATPSCLELLRDWYLHLLKDEGRAVNTIRRYHSTLAAAFCDMAGEVSLAQSDADTLEELYTLILEADERSALEQGRLRGRLAMLHRFAMQDDHWDFPEIAEELFVGEGSVTHVHATLLGRQDINSARDLLRTEYGLPPDVARAADAAMLAISRGALRIGEATKALGGHYEQVAISGLDPSEAMLFVKPSVFGNNKTPGAYRQVPLMKQMTAEEAADFETYLAYRRSLSPKGPLFGVVQPDGSVAPFHTRQLGAVIADCLRRATGLRDATAHALRRAAATAGFLCIHEARTADSQLGPFLKRLTGWTREDRARVVEAIAPDSQSRDRWQALARMLGHSGPGTSFEAYITVADLAIYETCALRSCDRDGASATLAGLAQRHVVLSPGAQEHHVAPRAAIRGKITSQAQALLQVLQSLDEGTPLLAAAQAAYIPVDFVETRLATARAWSSLKTTRGKLRLQPEDRQGKLAPAPLNAASKLAEALSLADDLIALAEKRPDAIKAWLLATLHDASEGNTGTRLHTPEALSEWCATAVLLRPPERWLVDRVDPVNVSAEAKEVWSGVRHPGTRSALRTSNTAKSIAVRCRMLNPEPDRTRKGKPASSWAGCVRFATHLAAVHLNICPRKD